MLLQSMTHAKNFKIKVIIAFFLLSGLSWLGILIYGRYYISTDNAYVNADIVQIAPRIPGQIVYLSANNNQFVKKDQSLFTIDPVPYNVALKKAEAQVAISEAELKNAEHTAKRTMVLVKKKFLSPQDGDNALTALSKATSALALAKAILEQAKLDFQYTTVTAPTSGWVTNLTLRVGDIVNTNQSLFVLISNQEFWIDANFKETEIEHIKQGQLATINIDMYPEHMFKGMVESISGGSGAAFSLLPPQNATGNWVKITQRVPVRIRILNPDPRYPLRIGTSASVKIALHEFSKK